MKTLPQLLIAGLVLVTPLFAQEPKRAVVPQQTIAETKISTDQFIATGAPQQTDPPGPAKSTAANEPVFGRDCPPSSRRPCGGPESSDGCCRRRSAGR